MYAIHSASGFKTFSNSSKPSIKHMQYTIQQKSLKPLGQWTIQNEQIGVNTQEKSFVNTTPWCKYHRKVFTFNLQRYLFKLGSSLLPQSKKKPNPGFESGHNKKKSNPTFESGHILYMDSNPGLFFFLGGGWVGTDGLCLYESHILGLNSPFKVEFK